MTEYDDALYQQFIEELTALVSDFLQMEGNDVDLLRTEVDNAIQNAILDLP